MSSLRPSAAPIPEPSKLAESFRYCPRCGRSHPDIRNERSLRCPHCGFLFFFNNAAASGAFVFHDGRLVLCVRAKNPGKGMLDVPGGFVEFDETVEDGLRREIHEELNIQVSALHYLTNAPNDYVYAGVPYQTTDLFFVCEADSLAGLKAADDVADTVLMHPAEVDPSAFAFVSTRRAFGALKDWLEPHRALSPAPSA